MAKRCHRLNRHHRYASRTDCITYLPPSFAFLSHDLNLQRCHHPSASPVLDFRQHRSSPYHRIRQAPEECRQCQNFRPQHERSQILVSVYGCRFFFIVTPVLAACRNRNFGRPVTHHAACRIERNSTVLFKYISMSIAVFFTDDKPEVRAYTTRMDSSWRKGILTCYKLR